MIRIPKELQPYIDCEDGKMIAVDMPEKLKPEFENLKKEIEKVEKENPFADL